MSSKVFIGSDHRGFGLKATFKNWLEQNNHVVVDVGTPSAERCDAGDFAVKLAESISGSTDKGILICGSGQAMAMTANRFKHVRAALCAEPVSARLTREHNDANVLVIGADVIGVEVALECLRIFFATPALGGRYAERVEKLRSLGGL